jgi:hypothetical protein
MDRRLLGTALATLALTLIAGCCVLALLVWRGAAAKGGWDEWLLVMGPIGATALVTAPVWWLVVVKSGRPGWGTGAAAGLCCGFLSYLIPALVLGFAGLVDPRQFDLGRAVGYTLAFLILEAVLTGWYTVPALAIIGAIMGGVQRRLITMAQNRSRPGTL